MQILTMYPLLREKRMLRMIKTASDLKTGWVRCLLEGLMLQYRMSGMKASLMRGSTWRLLCNLGCKFYLHTVVVDAIIPDTCAREIPFANKEIDKKKAYSSSRL